MCERAVNLLDTAAYRERSAVSLRRRRWRMVQQYATRWLIEEFHKALKTGLGAWGPRAYTGARGADLRGGGPDERGGHPTAGPAGVGAPHPRGFGGAREHGGLAALELEVLRGYTHQPLHTVGEVKGGGPGPATAGRAPGPQGERDAGLAHPVVDGVPRSAGNVQIANPG
jgi:hypothetical protein